MDFLDPEIESYVAAHSQQEPDLLSRLTRETYMKVLMPRMISGNLQGQVLRMICKMIKPRRILEIGTFTGYSAICLAEGLGDDGKLITLELNPELEKMARRYFEESGLQEKIDFRIGNAIDSIPGLTDEFDLVFIDADKENYVAYFDKIFDKVRTGGFIIADNVLWSGKVLLNKSEMDKDTLAICAFNEKVHADPRVEHVLLPIRDGLMLMRKI